MKGNDAIPEIVRTLSVSDEIKQRAIRRASADPLPGALNEAFVEGDIAVEGVTVRKIVLWDFVALKKLDNPFHRASLDAAQDGTDKVSFTEEETWDTCLLFTRTTREARAILNKGKEHFREVAICTFAEGGFQPEQIGSIVKAILEQMDRFYRARLSYAIDKPEEGDGGAVPFLSAPATHDKTTG